MPGEKQRPPAHLLAGNAQKDSNLPAHQDLGHHFISAVLDLKRPPTSDFTSDVHHFSVAIMPIRNPFKRGPGGVEQTEAISPELAGGSSAGFQKTNVVGAKPIDIKEPLEYKLSGKRKRSPRATAVASTFSTVRG